MLERRGGQGFRAIPRRRRAVAAAVLTALLLGAAACGEPSDETTTPGFDASPRPVDESPFELAKPTTTLGPTTIPGDPSTGQRTERNDTSTTTTTVIVTTTTTTTPISEPELREPVQIDSLCGMSRALQSLGLIITTPGLDVDASVVQLRRNMDRYVEVAPPNLRPTVESVARVITALIDVGTPVDFRADDPRLQRAISDAAGGTGDFAGFPAQVDIIARHEAATC